MESDRRLVRYPVDSVMTYEDVYARNIYGQKLNTEREWSCQYIVDVLPWLCMLKLIPERKSTVGRLHSHRTNPLVHNPHPSYSRTSYIDACFPSIESSPSLHNRLDRTPRTKSYLHTSPNRTL